MCNTEDVGAMEEKAFTTNEQWKGYGICEKCRRRDYCIKSCSARVNRISAEMQAFVARELMRKPGNGVTG